MRDDINPYQPDNKDQTPLWSASSNWHEGVVRLLLQQDDVNPDQSNNTGNDKTPL